MVNGKVRKIAGIIVVVLAVWGGAYLAGAKALCVWGSCDAQAKTAALAANDQTTCEKVHASTNDSRDAKATSVASSTCDAKAKNTLMTDADACPYLKSHTAKGAVAKENECSKETCPMAGSDACPMEKGAKGGATKAKKDADKKAGPKGVMAGMVPSPASSK